MFEIASGLGTPLNIDEATLHKRLGIFARVLIYVDLSAKLFESVVVEREDHVISISVQYEKYPMFCTHCNMLGHTIQNCAKLSTANKGDSHANVHQKHHNVNNKAAPKSSFFGKKDLNAPGSSSMFDKRSEAPKNFGPEPVNKVAEATVVKAPIKANVGVNAPANLYQTANIPAHIDLNEDSFDSADDFEEGEFQDMTESGVHNIEHPAMVKHKPIGGNLKLHNSFEVL